jgi:hypothetical protein
MLTYEEVVERLIRTDEITLLEVLEINSEDIVNRFEERITEKLEEFSAEFEEDMADYVANAGGDYEAS